MSRMNPFYAERIGGYGEPYIAERGVFYSIEEFVPYRMKGWTAASGNNKSADRIIRSMERVTCGNCQRTGPRSEFPHEAWGQGGFSCVCPDCERSIPSAFIKPASIAKAEGK